MGFGVSDERFGRVDRLVDDDGEVTVEGSGALDMWKIWFNERGNVVHRQEKSFKSKGSWKTE